MSIDYTNVMKNKGAYLTFKEVKLMFNYCYSRRDEWEYLRNFILLMTLFYSARRITEITGEKPWTKKVGLRPCDIRDDGLIEWDILKKNHIRTKTKSGKKKSEELLIKAQLDKAPVRKLKPIKKLCRQWLEYYIEEKAIHPTTRVFPITARRADQIVKLVALKCGIYRDGHKIHCHMFRHSYPIHLLKSNPKNPAVLLKLQELLDHSDIKMTMTYAQFTQYDIKELVDNTE